MEILKRSSSYGKWVVWCANKPHYFFKKRNAVAFAESEKSVEWAYPTSGSAVRFGFNAAGCWVVKLSHGISPSEAVAGYADKADALKHANSLPQPFSRIYLQFNPA